MSRHARRQQGSKRLPGSPSCPELEKHVRGREAHGRQNADECSRAKDFFAELFIGVGPNRQAVSLHAGTTDRIGTEVERRAEQVNYTFCQCLVLAAMANEDVDHSCPLTHEAERRGALCRVRSSGWLGRELGIQELWGKIRAVLPANRVQLAI